MPKQPTDAELERHPVLWKDTLWYNGLRSVGAGIVLAVVFSFIGSGSGEPMAGLSMLAFPGAYFMVFVPLGWILEKLSAIPFVPLFNLFLGLFVAVGDPLVWLTHRLAPEAVPVEKASFFRPRVLILVRSPLPK